METISEDLLQTQGLPVNPLENIITVDTFNESRSGYYMYHRDHAEHPFDWGVVCRSTASTHWWGSHGAQRGLYSLKLATKPSEGNATEAIKRITMPYTPTGDWYSTLRLESFFGYHEEPKGEVSNLEVEPEEVEKTGESAVRSFMFGFDMHNRENRWWPTVRYANYDGDTELAKWQYNAGGPDALPSDYTDIPGGSQNLCWNAPNDTLGWKMNWHYFRLDIDMENMRYDKLQCNDKVFDMSGLDRKLLDPVYEPNPKTSPWPEIETLLNIHMMIETNKDTRSMLFLDSVILSAEV
jgi:hypothetical protein